MKCSGRMLSVKHSVWPCRTLIFRPFAALSAVQINRALNNQGMATYALSPVAVVSVRPDLSKYGILKGWAGAQLPEVVCLELCR